MAESHLLTGLVAKRSELAGQIEALQRDLVSLTADVRTLDGAIKLVAPDFKLSTIKARRSRSKNKFFPVAGEASRFVLNTLRKAREPISTTNLTELARQRKGLQNPDMKALQACILTTLSRQRIKGVVFEAGRDETGAIKWTLAD